MIAENWWFEIDCWKLIAENWLLEIITWRLLFSWLSQDFLMTFSWFSHDFSKLSYDFLMISHDFFMTFSWLTEWLTDWLTIQYTDLLSDLLNATDMIICNCPKSLKLSELAIVWAFLSLVKTRRGSPANFTTLYCPSIFHKGDVGNAIHNT